MYQFHGKNAAAARQKLTSLVQEGLDVASLYKIPINPSTLSPNQLETLAYLGYINTHTVRKTDNWHMMTEASESEFARFEPKLQGSVTKPTKVLVALDAVSGG